MNKGLKVEKPCRVIFDPWKFDKKNRCSWKIDFFLRLVAWRLINFQKKKKKFRPENVLVEKVLNLLVGQVYAKLFEAVLLKMLEAIDVENSDLFKAFLGSRRR